MIELWSSSRWKDDEVVPWLNDRLAAAGITLTGPVELYRARPWAAVLTAPTTTGPVWFKATGAGTAFEVGLYELLERIVPERVLAPIATDVGRGWMVLPDGGPPLADRADGDEWAGVVGAVLTRYAELQRAFAPEVDAALAAGVSDMRPEVMPRRFDEALEAASAGIVAPADPEAIERIAAARPAYVSWCERLAAAPGPASIDHNDLHPWNMLVADVGRPDEVRFYDWGDAVVAHPFACLLVPLGMAQSRDPAGVARMRDAYLEAFADLAPHAELVEAVELACRVAKVARAMTWQRALGASAPADVEERFATAPMENLLALLDDSYLGGG